MHEELQQVDTSVIEELQAIKREQDVLQGRLDTMHSRSGEVSEKVYERVRADYQSRYHALEEQARPLKARARTEFARLDAVARQLETALEDAQLAREELEFRNELGEFEEGIFKQRLAECEALLKGCQERVGEGERLRARFVAAFHSEEDLTAGEEELPPPPSGEQDTTRASDHEAEHEHPSASAEAPPDVVTPPPLTDDHTDVSGTAPLPIQPEPASTPPTPGVVQPAAEPPDAPTEILRPVRLIQEDDGQEHAVKMPTTTIGRAPNNDIAIPDGAISRHHAKIDLTESGFVIVDLGSENGVFVNGERVTERLLATGDQIEVGPGTRRYTFLWE